MQPPHSHAGLAWLLCAVVIIVRPQLLGTQAGAHMLGHECELACACAHMCCVGGLGGSPVLCL